jgi:uncharacterized protein (DUF4415 family)
MLWLQIPRKMKKNYDFSHGKRGAVIKTPPGKTRITIRIDDDVLQWFRSQVHFAGGGNYQTMINQALRAHIEANAVPLRETLRSVVREELAAYGISRGKRAHLALPKKSSPL